MCVCLSAGISLEPLDWSLRNLVCRSPVAVAQSSSGGVTIRYVHPVLWMRMTSRLAVVNRPTTTSGVATPGHNSLMSMNALFNSVDWAINLKACRPLIWMQIIQHDRELFGNCSTTVRCLLTCLDTIFSKTDNNVFDFCILTRLMLTDFEFVIRRYCLLMLLHVAINNSLMDLCANSLAVIVADSWWHNGRLQGAEGNSDQQGRYTSKDEEVIIHILLYFEFMSSLGV